MLDIAINTTMAKNYSHCPLKKRPFQFCEEKDIMEQQNVEQHPFVNSRKRNHIPTPPPIKIEIEESNDEPENLSTKPEDLSKRARMEQQPSPPVSFATSVITSYPPKVESPQEASEPKGLPSPRMNPISITGGAFHRVIRRTISPEPVHYAPTTWHRSVAPHYPPAYFPVPGAAGGCYPSPYSSGSSSTSEVYHPYPMYPASPPSPYAPRDSSCSPPARITPHAPIALLPDYRTRASLSPASSSGISSIRSQSPIHEPADLSPPTALTVLSINSLNPQDKQSTGNSRVTSSRHQCPDCGKSYSTFSGLSKHRQFHCAASNDGPRKSFSCKYCEKVYVSLGALKMHIRTHTLPCKCTLCGKAFSRPWLLQGHIRTHTGEKPFSCQHCHRAFADRSNLRAHLQTHSEVKKYSCPTCSKTFSRMSLLTKHAEGGGCNSSSITPATTPPMFQKHHPDVGSIPMHQFPMY